LDIAPDSKISAVIVIHPNPNIFGPVRSLDHCTQVISFTVRSLAAVSARASSVAISDICGPWPPMTRSTPGSDSAFVRPPSESFTLETDMFRRGMMFEVIDWSEDQARLPSEE
jgi:hypothetical protein